MFAKPGARPTIQNYLLKKIVGIVLLAFVIFVEAIYFAIIRPGQNELARTAMARASGQVENDVRELFGYAELQLASLRDWCRSGMPGINTPLDFASLMIPFLNCFYGFSLCSNIKNQECA